MRVVFGDCTLDSETRELLRDGHPVHLSPKAFALLEILLAERPKAVSKERLHDVLWPRTFVSEANLASLVAEARAAIGDPARGSKLLRTVYGFGYAFSGEASEDRPVSDVRSRGRFFLLKDEKEIALSPGENVLGREASASIRIDDDTVSRHHARIAVEGREATIDDLGSKNGTLVDGRSVGPKPVPLVDGAEIQVGSVFLSFRVRPDQKSTRTLRGRRPR